MSAPTGSLHLPLAVLEPGDGDDTVVSIATLLGSPEAHGAAGPLPVVLGVGEHGMPVVLDLTEAPHVLVGGTTGAGKSVFVHGALLSLLARHEPRTLRLLLVDTKRLELGPYEALPHLRHPVVFESAGAALVLRWLALEVAERTDLLARNGCRSLDEFNRRVQLAHMGRDSGLRRVRDPNVPFDDRPYDGGELPFFVLVVDDLADVLEVEGTGELLQHVAESGRAVGVHLLCVTQRPGALQVPAPLKALFPTRISFRLPAAADSRTILERPGAERLPGVGTMIVVSPSDPDGQVVRGAYVSPDVIDRAIGWYWTAAEQSVPGTGDRQSEPAVRDIVRMADARAGRLTGDESFLGDDAHDSLLRDAAEVVIAEGGGLTSLLQRRLKIGYGRAARLLDQLHFSGVLGPPDGSKPRAVLIRIEDLDSTLGVGGVTASTGAVPTRPASSAAGPSAKAARTAGRSAQPPTVSPPPATATPLLPAPRPKLPLIDRILRLLGG